MSQIDKNMKPNELTPKTMSLGEVLKVLANGEFNFLIGAIESVVLDFKGSPYRLDSTRDKLELAKDVSALANFQGGLIVMGVKTTKVEGRQHELAEEIRGFEETLLHVEQYGDVIREYVYPRVNLEIKWVPSIADNKKGLAYIRIPESESERKPFLTVTVLQEDDKVLGNVVGFFQRKGDKVVHWSVEEMYHTFKDGLRYDQYLSEIGEAVGKMLSQRELGIPSEDTATVVKRRIESAIETVGLKDSVSYVLASYPDTNIEILGLFESRNSDIVKLIDQPPEIRSYGFDISTEERSKIVNGEFRRSVLKSYKLLEVWRDGAIVLVADGDEGFLCWGNYDKRKFLRINTIALIESVYLFSFFVKKVFEVGGAPECNVQMGLQIKNIPQERKYGLPRAKPGSLSWQFDLDREIAWTSERNLSVSHTWAWKNTSPENAAYKLVRELYAKFGLEHEFIPYVKEQNSEKVIDVEQIKNVR